MVGKLKTQKNSLILFFLIMFSVGRIYSISADEAEHKLVFSILPEVQRNSDVIVRVRIFLENKGEHSVWVREEDLCSERMGFVVASFGGEAKSTGGEGERRWTHSEKTIEKFIEIPRGATISKVIKLSKDRYLSIPQVLSNKSSCTLKIKIKNTELSESPEKFSRLYGKSICGLFSIEKYDVGKSKEFAFTFPEADAASQRIKRLHVFYENTSEEAVWVHLNNLKVEDGESETVAKISDSDEYVEVLPKMGYGEVIELPEDSKIELEKYMQGKVAIQFFASVKDAMEGESKEIDIKPKLIKADFPLDVEKENVIDLEQYRYFSAYVVPETNITGDMITRVRIFFENKISEPAWIQYEELSEHDVSVVTVVSDHETISNADLRHKPPVAYGEYVEPVYTKVPANGVVGKVVALSEKGYIKWDDYINGKVTINIITKFKQGEGDATSAFPMGLKAILMPTSFNLSSEIKNTSNTEPR